MQPVDAFLLFSSLPPSSFFFLINYLERDIERKTPKTLKINNLEYSAQPMEKRPRLVGRTPSKINDLASYPPQSTRFLRCLCFPCIEFVYESLPSSTLSSFPAVLYLQGVWGRREAARSSRTPNRCAGGAWIKKELGKASRPHTGPRSVDGVAYRPKVLSLSSEITCRLETRLK